MTVRQLDPTLADQISAQVFFQALFHMYDLEQGRVLDAFARTGQLTVKSYVDFLAAPRTQLEVWEQQAEHESALRTFTPQVQIGDSYQLITEVRGQQFDLLVVDTPQGLHTDSDGTTHAEHWDFVKLALPSMRSGGLVVLYVNKQPYDARQEGHRGYDIYPEYNYDEWMYQRQKLYGFARSPYEERFIEVYRRLFQLEGRSIQSMLLTPCHSDVPGLLPYAFRVGFQVM